MGSSSCPRHAETREIDPLERGWRLGKRSGDFPKSITLYQRALELDPLARISQLQLAVGYAATGDNRQALDIWLENARTNPDFPDPLDSISMHLVGLGRLDEALAWAFKAASLSVAPHGLLAPSTSLRALGLKDEAIEYLRAGADEDEYGPLRLAQAQRMSGDVAGALTSLSAEIATSQFPQPAFLRVAAEMALQHGDYAKARTSLERLCPSLKDPAPSFDVFGECSGVPYGYVLQRLGDRDRAGDVLRQYMTFLGKSPRLGRLGYAVADVEALALLGRREEALARLRQAIDSGWRALNTPGWSLVDDPYLATLRDDARFRAMAAEVDADVRRMRERAVAARVSGNWQPLLALAAQGNGRVAAK